jgi:mRNA interferase MazF
MKKNYSKWHILKTELNSNQARFFFHEREIWYCSLGLNIGHEQDGKHERFERPILILKKINRGTFLGIPLTTRQRRGKYCFDFIFRGKIQFAILSQIRLLDSKRLLRKFGTMNKANFRLLRGVLRSLI